jgi:radical SAM protein with 4Fe4S-binding SPASM domain
MRENETPRFTARPEYFGGLIYDAREAKTVLLEPHEYKMLQYLSEKEDIFFDTITEGNNTIRDRLLGFQKKGFIEKDPDSGKLSLVSLRFVHPEIIPANSLTAPVRVFDTYTLQCNLDCGHCMLASNIFVHEPNRRTVAQTAEIMRKFHDAGTMEWRFTGGEASIHPDLFDSMQIAHDLGMNYGLYTNGWWNERNAQKIVESGVYELVISLEGREFVNDSRRKKGAFRKTLESFNRILDHNALHPDHPIKVTIAAAIGKDNMGDIEFLGDIAVEYGFDLNFMPLKPSGRAQVGLMTVMPTTQEYMEFSRAVQKLRERPDIKSKGVHITYKYKDLFNPAYPDSSDKPAPFNYAECGALTTAISMMPDGTLFSCPFILDFDKAGEFTGPNILNTSVQEAWLDPRFQKFRHVEKVECKDCKYYMKQCRGACKATVLGYGGSIENGKLVGHDEYCYMPLLLNNE